MEKEADALGCKQGGRHAQAEEEAKVDTPGRWKRKWTRWTLEEEADAAG